MKDISFDADISPAIAELKKLHRKLVEAFAKREQMLGREVHEAGMRSAIDTVISIVPAGRRREMGWYMPPSWERKSERVLQKLDPDFVPNQYHEIYIAGEALAGDLEDIVLLMMHQVAHQAAGIRSIPYHGRWFPAMMNRGFAVPEDAWTRDPSLGWMTLNKDKAPGLTPLLKGYAAHLNEAAFDLFRSGDRVSRPSTTGSKMYLWHCDGCPKPVKVRTGGVLMATCDRCGKPLLLQDQNAPTSLLTRVPVSRRKLV